LPLLHSERICTLQPLRLLVFVSSAHYLTSGIAHRYLLPYNGSHVVKPDCLAEFNDFGSNRAKKYFRLHPVDCWLEYTYFMRIGQSKLSERKKHFEMLN
jgi:hypothetical protein